MINKTEFWNWFEKNNAPYLFIQEMDAAEQERVLSLLMEKLHEYNNQLIYDMIMVGDVMELQISARGVEEEFQSVIDLVEAAPEIDNWNIVAFKQPGGALEFTLQGIHFDAEDMHFCPLTNPQEPDAIGFIVCHRGYSEEKRSDFLQGTYTILEGLIGEWGLIKLVDYIQLQTTPDNIDKIGLPLTELPDYIQWRFEEKEDNNTNDNNA